MLLHDIHQLAECRKIGRTRHSARENHYVAWQTRTERCRCLEFSECHVGDDRNSVGTGHDPVVVDGNCLYIDSSSTEHIYSCQCFGNLKSVCKKYVCAFHMSVIRYFLSVECIYSIQGWCSSCSRLCGLGL